MVLGGFYVEGVVGFVVMVREVRIVGEGYSGIGEGWSVFVFLFFWYLEERGTFRRGEEGFFYIEDEGE